MIPAPCPCPGQGVFSCADGRRPPPAGAGAGIDAPPHGAARGRPPHGAALPGRRRGRTGPRAARGGTGRGRRDRAARDAGGAADGGPRGRGTGRGGGTRTAAAHGAGSREGTIGGSGNPCNSGTSAPPRAPPAPAPRMSHTPPGVFPDFGFAPDRLGVRLKGEGGCGPRLSAAPCTLPDRECRVGSVLTSWSLA